MSNYSLIDENIKELCDVDDHMMIDEFIEMVLQ